MWLASSVGGNSLNTHTHRHTRLTLAYKVITMAGEWRDEGGVVHSWSRTQWFPEQIQSPEHCLISAVLAEIKWFPP